jgi:hypothetical protein
MIRCNIIFPSAYISHFASCLESFLKNCTYFLFRSRISCVTHFIFSFSYNIDMLSLNNQTVNWLVNEPGWQGTALFSSGFTNSGFFSF